MTSYSTNYIRKLVCRNRLSKIKIGVILLLFIFLSEYCPSLGVLAMTILFSSLECFCVVVLNGTYDSASRYRK